MPKKIIGTLIVSITVTFCTFSSAGTMSGFVVGAAAAASPKEEKSDTNTPIKIAGSNVFYCPNFQGVTCTIDGENLPGAARYATAHGLRYFNGYKFRLEQIIYLAGGSNAKIKNVTIIPGRTGTAQAVLEWE